MVSFNYRLWSMQLAPAPGLRGAGLLFVVLVLVSLAAGCTARRPAATASRSETAERFSQEARQARDRGDLPAAESLMQAAVDRNPGDGEMRLELAELLLERGNGMTAAHYLQQLIRELPDDPRPYVGLAEALYAQQDLEEAATLVEKALELEPRQTRGLLLRGKIERARRHDERALEDLYQVISFDPDHVEARMLIAELHFQQGDIRLAAPLLRGVIETAEAGNLQQTKAQWLLGQCYARDGRWPDAARALRAGISGRRASPKDWYELADASRRAGDIREAEAALGHALQLSPSDPQLLALRGALDDQVRSAGFRGAPIVTSLAHEETVPAPPPVPPQILAPGPAQEP